MIECFHYHASSHRSVDPIIDQFITFFCSPNWRTFLYHYLRRCLLVPTMTLGHGQCIVLIGSNYVSEFITNSIVFIKNVVIKVWHYSNESFSHGELNHISELQQEIYSLKQDSRLITEFFFDLKILWEEFLRVESSCQDMRNARNNHNLIYIIWFLTSLNDNFAMIKSQVLLMDQLHSFNKLFYMVIPR